MIELNDIGFKIILIILYVIISVRLMTKKREMIFYLTMFIFNLLGFLSLILIEGGAYITEEQMVGFPNGAFYVFYIFVVSTLIVFYFSIKTLKIDIKFENKQKLFYVYSFILFLVILYARILNPNFNRFDISFSFPGRLQSIVVFLIMGYWYLYFYCILQEKSIKVKLKYLLFYSSLQFFRGDQFGGTFQAIMLFITAIVLHGQFSIKIGKYNRKKIILVLSLFTLLIFTSIYIKFKLLGGEIEFLNRIILQNHIIWGTINLIKQQGINLNFSAYFDHFFSLGAFKTTIEYGFGKLMYEISGNYAALFINEGARFTDGYPAILIYHFGYLASFIINIFLTYLLIRTICLKFYILKKYNFVLFAISLKLIESFEELYNMGEFGSFNLKWVIFLLILTLLMIIIGKKRKTYQIKNYRASSGRSISLGSVSDSPLPAGN